MSHISKVNPIKTQKLSQARVSYDYTQMGRFASLQKHAEIGEVAREGVLMHIYAMENCLHA